MPTLKVPISGLLLVSHLTAYSLGATLEAGGERVFVGHDPDSLELEPRVETRAALGRVLECVRRTAMDCRRVVEADLAPGRPAIWARFTDTERAPAALQLRERLLDEAETSGAALSARLLAGLGAPAAWLAKAKPSQGASQLDGVAGNSTSDFVRGVLRRTLSAALDATSDELHALWCESEPPIPDDNDEDKTGWSPPGVRIHPLHQWLAAVGLTQLTVGLSASGRSRTPCCWRNGPQRGVRLPIPDAPISMPMLRALLMLPELAGPEVTARDAARLRAIGVAEVLNFRVIDQAANPNMVAFRFGRGDRLELR
jgi:hypothetical protein